MPKPEGACEKTQDSNNNFKDRISLVKSIRACVGENHLFLPVRHRSFDKAAEERMRLVRLGLEFGMELAGGEPGVIRQFDQFDQFLQVCIQSAAIQLGLYISSPSPGQG